MEGFGFGMLIAIIVCFAAPLFGAKEKDEKKWKVQSRRKVKVGDRWTESSSAQYVEH